MPLYLVQHGQSFTKEQDPDRPLTEEGRATVERMARLAAGHGIQVDLIRHSGKTRARQTAEILAAILGPVGGVASAQGMDPNDDVVPFSQALHASENALWVGHLPFLERLVSYLITGDPEKPVIKLQNGGILCLDQDPARNTWCIRWMLFPEIR